MPADLLADIRAAAEAFRRAEAELPALTQLAQLAATTLKKGGTILACGNGGSNAQALHLVEELTGRFRRDRPPLRAIALGADAPAITCTANDYGFAEIFARPLVALARPGDLLIAFSTSGNSDNILRALEAAKTIPATTALVTGAGGGRAAALADHVLRAPSDDTARVQELHTFYLHAILTMIEHELFGA